eukprot:TRINITY_DN32636_c0_g1_i1.p1 TRINITY_DN32636_c0_g1~~TRINITY_DN32636_c0_g1_i1.p1  ORF type:complete len:330 (+),score=129.11 TRINITY_DN32636_c0_g1_i1:49-1038(+)
MEKYRRFADHATGIQPFIPARTAASAVHRFVAAPLLILLRAPLLVLLVVGWIVPCGLVLPAVVGAVVPALGQLLRAMFLSVGVRMLLLVMGVFSTEKFWPLTTATVGLSEAMAPKGGDVVLANFTSYVDVLYYTAAYAPVFGFAHDDGITGAPRVVTKGSYGAVGYAVSTYAEQLAQFASAEGIEAAVAAAKAKNAPLVLFFEGTPTTGKGVLACPDKLLAGVPAASKFFVHTLTYADCDADVPFVSLGSPWAHFAALLGRAYHTQRSVKIMPSKTPQRAALPDAAILQRTLVAKLCEASGLRALALKRSDKAGFLAHWKQTGGDAYLK